MNGIGSPLFNSFSTATRTTPAAATQSPSAKVEQGADMASARVSNRAQNIAKLSEEFFPDGPQSIKITPAFIQRLHDYQLISQSDADRLSKGMAQAPEQSRQPLPLLLEFAEVFSNEHQDSEAHKPLLDWLDRTQNLFSNLAHSPQEAKQAKDLSLELTALLNNQAEGLSEAEFQGFEGLNMALLVTHSLGPGAASEQGVNQYLNRLKGY